MPPRQRTTLLFFLISGGFIVTGVLLITNGLKSPYKDWADKSGLAAGFINCGIKYTCREIQYWLQFGKREEAGDGSKYSSQTGAKQSNHLSNRQNL